MTTVEPEALDRWRDALAAETDAAAVYRALAGAEKNDSRRGLLEALAADEERHATNWEEKLREAGVDSVEPEPGQRARLFCRLAPPVRRHCGPPDHARSGA